MIRFSVFALLVLAILVCGAIMLAGAIAFAPPSLAQPPQGRLTDDRRALILLDEVREPVEKRQPEIRFGTSAKTGSAEIRISGQGIHALRQIGVLCGGGVLAALSLSTFSETPDRTVATYELSKRTAARIARPPNCAVSLAGAVVEVPADLLSVVWSKTLRPAGSGSREERSRELDLERRELKSEEADPAAVNEMLHEKDVLEWKRNQAAIRAAEQAESDKKLARYCDDVRSGSATPALLAQCQGLLGR